MNFLRAASKKLMHKAHIFTTVSCSFYFIQRFIVSDIIFLILSVLITLK